MENMMKDQENLEDVISEDNTEAVQAKPKKVRKPRTPKTKSLKLGVSSEDKTSNTESSAQFYVATSMTRPLNPVINSIVYETDTGHRVQFNGYSWDFIDALH